VADVLQLSTKSVYAIVARGELPAYRVGGSVRIAQADLDAYMDERRSTGQQRTVTGAARLKYLKV
jgi:putative molybdopterin biosynthesis protein